MNSIQGIKRGNVCNRKIFSNPEFPLTNGEQLFSTWDTATCDCLLYFALNIKNVKTPRKNPRQEEL
jgi:hypothetical protein